MNKSVTAIAFALASTLLFAAPATQAADSGAKPRTPQQQRMSKCGHESKGMKGDERKKFMHDCLSGKDDKSVETAKPAAKTDDKDAKPPVV